MRRLALFTLRFRPKTSHGALGVLVACGLLGSMPGTAQGQFELTWNAGGEMQNPHRWHAAATLQDGRVLVTGGSGNPTSPNNTAEIFNPANDTWAAASPMIRARYYHSAT